MPVGLLTTREVDTYKGRRGERKLRRRVKGKLSSQDIVAMACSWSIDSVVLPFSLSRRS